MPSLRAVSEDERGQMSCAYQSDRTTKGAVALSGGYGSVLSGLSGVLIVVQDQEPLWQSGAFRPVLASRHRSWTLRRPRGPPALRLCGHDIGPLQQRWLRQLVGRNTCLYFSALLTSGFIWRQRTFSCAARLHPFSRALTLCSFNGIR